MPQPSLKKPTSLFGALFQKKDSPQEPQSLNDQPLSAQQVPVEELTVEQNAPAKEETHRYTYVSSWQMAMNTEEDATQEASLINAEGAAHRLNSIFTAKAEETVHEPDEPEPRCVSSQAAERFAQALHAQEEGLTIAPSAPSPDSSHLHTVNAVPSGENRTAGFADRLRQRVETSLAQS